MISKQGKNMEAPIWFVKDLPSTPLDGELWMGQGSLELLQKAIQFNSWIDVGYYVFDLPASKNAYEDRLKQLDSMKYLFPPHVRVVESIECTGMEHLRHYLDLILEKGGEGVMARQPCSLYEPNMVTSSLLKVKVKGCI